MTDSTPGAGRPYELSALALAAGALAQDLLKRGWMVATAESCTGGLVSAACTELAGSSNWFERGFVSYSNRAKQELLGVPAALIDAHGAVSREVAEAMAEGAVSKSQAQLGISVTGIAGPGGAVPGKPVGTVWIAVAISGRPTLSERLQLDGDRNTIRGQTVLRALAFALESLNLRPAGEVS